MAEEKKDEVKKEIAKAGMPIGFVLVLIVAFLLTRGSMTKNPKEVTPEVQETVKVVTNENLPISRTLITPNNTRIAVQVVDTARTRDIGLSGFKVLPENQGMLFIFQSMGTYPFWMKNMKFPLDIIWMKRISGNEYQVVAIVPNALPESYPQVIEPHAEADTVLEVNAFKAEQFGIKVGSVLMQ